jgi:hypothetical protein
VAAPPRVTVAPAPALSGLIVPLIEYVLATGLAVKFTPVTFAFVIVTFCEGGLNVFPLLAGVIEYEPLGRLLNA